MVLIMAVALTIGLAVISRSVTDIRISKQDEESARVFSVAEAGIEEALKLGAAPTGGVTVGGITATVQQIDMGGTLGFAFPEAVEANSVVNLWLVEHQGDVLDTTDRYTGSQIELYWGKTDAPVSAVVPALEATLIYDSSGFKVRRYPLDPNGSRGNNFVLAESGSYLVDGQNFKYKKTIDLPNGIKYVLRLKLLYNDIPQTIGVKGIGDVLPNQGVCYLSTATQNPQTSGITRAVKQCRYYKAPPGIFDYVLYSGTDLEK